MVAICVDVYHQSYTDAWKLTFRELQWLIDYKAADGRRQDKRISVEKVHDLEQSLIDRGVIEDTRHLAEAP